MRADFVHPGGASDDPLVERLVALVNDAYAAAEEGLWVSGAARTSLEEMRSLVAGGEIAAAWLDGALVGCVRIRSLDDERGELGMLAADPSVRGHGIGTALVSFAESESRARGHRVMELEVLTPREWVHPSKKRLDEWYRRMGYRVARTGDIGAAYPHLRPKLATPCDFVIYEKALT